MKDQYKLFDFSTLFFSLELAGAGDEMDYRLSRGS